MKKYIAIATLLAAGSAFANAAVGDVFVLDSKLVAGGSSSSAYDSIVGESKNGALETGIQIDRLGYTNCSATIKLAELLSDVTLEKGQSYSVESISFAARYDKASSLTDTYTPTGVNLTLSFNGESVTATSYNLAYNLDRTTDDANCVIGFLTFSFANALVIEKDAVGTLTASISALDKKLGFTVAKDSDTVDIQGTQDFTSGWNPIVRLSGTVIPEPSMFGLLAGLGALALVGTRRRRK